jgi:hypothetical protein
MLGKPSLPNPIAKRGWVRHVRRIAYRVMTYRVKHRRTTTQ